MNRIDGRDEGWRKNLEKITFLCMYTSSHQWHPVCTGVGPNLAVDHWTTKVHRPHSTPTTSKTGGRAQVMQWLAIIGTVSLRCVWRDTANGCVCTPARWEHSHEVKLPPLPQACRRRVAEGLSRAVERVSQRMFWQWHPMPCFMGNSSGTARKSEVHWECVKCEVSC